MIQDAKGLGFALDQMKRLQLALASIRAEHPDASPGWLAVLAEGFIDQVRQLQQQIDAFTGVEAIEQAQAELWLSIEGRGIGAGVGPASVLTALLDAFRKGVQAAAEFLEAGRLARRPTALLKAACDWQVVALAPGSMRIGIRLPEQPIQRSLMEEPEIHVVRKAVSDFLNVASWAGSEESPEGLAAPYPDQRQRRLLLNAVKAFAPRPRGGVRSVTISGRNANNRLIRLTRDAAFRIDNAIDQTAEEQVENHVGDLREIDLDNVTMILRNVNDVQEVRCTLDESLLEVAKESLDRRVQVSGVRRITPGRGPLPALHVYRLELLDDSSADEDLESAASSTSPAP
jgi:hypothetical protein